MDYKQRTRYLALAAIILGLLKVQNALGESVVTTPPSDVVQRIGENAQFFCKITGIPEAEAVQWSRTTHVSGTEELIYKTHLPKPLDETKYNFTKTAPLETNIVVKNLEMKDAGLYKCAQMTDTTEGKMAELVVVDNPEPSVLDILEAGKVGRLSCVIYYLSSKDSALEPELFAMIGTWSIPTDDVTTGDLFGKYWKRLDYEEIFQASQHGQNFTCGARVVRNFPTPIDFTISVSKELHIKYATMKTEVTEDLQEMYYPGDSIECIADGYPEPTLSWIPIESEGAGEISGGQLVISEQMIGKNVWKCRATQDDDPSTEIESDELSFEVLPPTDPPTGDSTGADATTVGVAVGVSVALLLGVIVIVVFFVCKKIRARGAKPKRTEAIEEHVEARSASERKRNQIYKPLAINPEGEVCFQEQRTNIPLATAWRPSGQADLGPTYGPPSRAQLEYEEERASYRSKDSTDNSDRPSAAPYHPQAGRVSEI